MTAQDIVDRLLEAEPLDSLEAVPDYNAWFRKALHPGTPEHRDYRLLHNKPRNAAEARALGVDWFIKDGRRYQVSLAEPPPGRYPHKSSTMATNRNLRRKSFGYRDVYSTRERGWPMPNRKAYYRAQDRALARRRADAENKVNAFIGSGI